MTLTERARIIYLIGKHTDFDVATVVIGRTGFVTAKLDPDKTPGCSRDVRVVARVSDFANGANPFCA